MNASIHLGTSEGGVMLNRRSISVTGGSIAAAAPVLSAEGLIDQQMRRRSMRVTCLTLAMVLMSLADLQITLIYVRTVGMGEGNPIARYIMSHNSAGMLILWKCASIGLATLVFLRYRKRRLTEAACWFSCAVLVWLLVRWIGYADEAWHLTTALHTLPDAETAMWVRMGE